MIDMKPENVTVEKTQDGQYVLKFTTDGDDEWTVALTSDQAVELLQKLQDALYVP